MRERAAFVLIHGPICGPDTWWPVADALGTGGTDTVVPTLETSGAAPFWRAHTRSIVHSIAQEVPPGVPLILVAHDGAGQLLGVLGLVLRDVGYRVASYILADAGLPPENQSRLEQLQATAPDFAAELRQHLADGGSFPNWTDASLRSLIPDSERRHRLIAGVRQPPHAFWRETIPRAAGWPEAPVGVLLFSRSYEGTARAARERGWPMRRLSANNHFLCLTDENAVAEELLVLADDLIRSTAA